jgi:hypothetical protein
LGATAAGSAFSPVIPLPAPAEATSSVTGESIENSTPSVAPGVTIPAQGQSSDSLRSLEPRTSADAENEPPIASDEDAAVQQPAEVESGANEAALDPRQTWAPLSQLMPELSGMVSRAFGIDVSVWDRAVADLLDEAEDAGRSVLDTLDDVDLWSWLIATSAAAVSLEIVRRESRRARLDTIAAWGGELLGEADPS